MEKGMIIFRQNRKSTIMKKNMGKTDKMIRFILAVIIAALYYTNVISGTIGLVLVALAGIFVLTSLVSFCPLYLPFGANTCEKEED